MDHKIDQVATESSERVMPDHTNGDVAVPDPENADQKREPFGFTPDVTLEQVRVSQRKFSDDRNWAKFHTPRNLVIALSGEMGELSECFQWRGEVEEGLPGWSEEDKEHVGEEIADVVIYATRLADVCGIDLAAAILRKTEINNAKYPVAKSYGSCKKYTAYLTPAAEENGLNGDKSLP